MSVRDRYDVSDKKAQADSQRAGYVRQQTQQATAMWTIAAANDAARAGTAGPFARALVVAWAEQRRAEGY